MKFNLNPKETLSNDEIKEGLSLLKLDGIFSQSMSILLSGTFTVPLLLLLGANRFHIGLLSFIISLSSFTQLLSPIIANKFYSRKKVSVLFSLLTRLFLLALSISLILGFITNIFILLIFFSFFYLLANISSGTFSFWMLDLVPNDIRGSYFASRTKTSMLIGSLIGLSVALYIGYFITDEKIIYYSFIILLAAILGLIGVFFLANVPEPKFKNLEAFSINGMKNLLKVKNIRIHHTAMFLLYLAMGISTPFFIYYLIAILGFDTITVFIVTMTSQFVTIFLLPKWGFLVDKYGVKPVLRLSSFIMISTLLLWPFTTLPGRHPLSLLIVFVIYILMGLALGGLNLSSGLIAYKLVENNGAHYEMPLNNITISLGTAIGAVIGSILSIPYKRVELSTTITISLENKVQIFLINIKDLDFVFITSAMIGFLAISLLRKYKIDNEPEEEKNYLKMIIGLKRSVKCTMDHLLVTVSDRVIRRNSNYLSKRDRDKIECINKIPNRIVGRIPQKEKL
ncbi:MAG: MFS transporter [Candidatus Njordarchaeum guaymaensis]